MKTFLSLLIALASSVACGASEQQQTFVISNKPIYISETLRVKQFDPDKGTLTVVQIQSKWEVETSSEEWEVDLSLSAPGPNGPLIETNTLTETSTGNWGLGIGISAGDIGLSNYIGEGTIDFQVSFTGVVLPEPATGSLKLTVTYTYEH